MDPSNIDTAPAPAAAAPLAESHPAVEPAESEPTVEPVAPALTIAAPATEPQLPPAATLPPLAPAAAAPVLPPAAPAAAVPATPPAETPRSVEPPKRAAEPPAVASAPDAPRRAPPVVTAPVIAARPGARRHGSERSGRFTILAMLTALAAGIGGALGATGFAAMSNMMAPAPEPGQQRAAAVEDIKAELKALRDQVAQARAGIKVVSDNVGALKGGFESANKSSAGQFAKMGETIARLSEGVDRAERLQAEPAARLSKVIETLERLERRAAGLAGTAETTASVPGQQGRTLGQGPQSLQQQQQQLQAQPAAPPPLPPPQVVADGKASTPPVIDSWVLLRVQGGVALIEGRYGLAEVEAGDNIRGLGRVQEIKRQQDGRWMVVTARGLILPAR
jgi:hypothetical protein